MMVVITHVGSWIAETQPTGHFFSDVFNIIVAWLGQASKAFAEWIARPEVWPLIILWFVVFWAVLFILLALGFGRAGVVAGSLAAAFQSWMYGAFTPAGGVFAVLTSIGMMGVFVPTRVLFAAALATAVTILVYMLR